MPVRRTPRDDATGDVFAGQSVAEGLRVLRVDDDLEIGMGDKQSADQWHRRLRGVYVVPEHVDAVLNVLRKAWKNPVVPAVRIEGFRGTVGANGDVLTPECF